MGENYKKYLDNISLKHEELERMTKTTLKKRIQELDDR